MGLLDRMNRQAGTVPTCGANYPHHAHLIVRDTMRSISDAPWCEGIPAQPVQSPFTRAALAGTLPAKVIR